MHGTGGRPFRGPGEGWGRWGDVPLPADLMPGGGEKEGGLREVSWADVHFQKNLAGLFCPQAKAPLASHFIILAVCSDIGWERPVGTVASAHLL